MNVKNIKALEYAIWECVSDGEDPAEIIAEVKDLIIQYEKESIKGEV